MLNMIKAASAELEILNKLYTDCIDHLNKNGIFQWDGSYPNKNTCMKSIAEESHYIFQNDADEPVGAVVLNELQADEWKAISWKYQEDKTLIIHALAIDPLSQGRGYGQRILEMCEEYGREQGYTAMRLDAFSENPAAVRLYEKNGYERAGELIFDFKPEGHQLYYCYERLL